MNKIKFLNYVFLILLFATVFFYPKTLWQNSKVSSTSAQYEQLVQQYEVIKQTELSDLQDILIEIINARLKCYTDTSDYSLRLSECRKKYQYAILRAARENLKSSPSLGEFLLCIQNCPLSYSFCNGEELSEGNSKNCRNIEVLCIERCLDDFWRGNSLNDDTTN
ncbi:MAG: hypothetical protein HQK73_04235 [Desulfamplus sp.]|nr:hypothetical protein [Desulfamplus sp.]MBF0411816.1 hypothetical protein [Desulfamplus sp.]